jgi:hypothetical protein
LGSSKPEDYGSAIRQASYVEAFAGFRNDPYQPYTAEYCLPFEAILDLGKASDYSADGFTTIYKTTYVIGEQVGADAFSSPKALRVPEEVLRVNTGDSDWYKIVPTQYTFDDICVDGLIRGSEEILISNSDSTALNQWRFPSSLVDFNINLSYFIGSRPGIERGTGQDDSPHSSGGRHYKKVIDGDIDMIPAYQASMTSTTNDIKTKIPIVITDRNTLYAVNSAFNLNSTVGYSSAVGLWPAGSTLSGWRSKFPLFNGRYQATLGDKMFVVLLNIHDRTDQSEDHNSPVPYQIYVEDTELKMRVTGTMNFKMITSYHKSPSH